MESDSAQRAGLPVTVELAVLVLVSTIVFGRRADHAIRTRLRAGIDNR